MDIHRSRFVPYPPSAINALAFSHTVADSNDEDPSTLRLAVGRANGNIEIWNPTCGRWLQERVFSGGKDRSVEGLVWIQELDTNVAGKRIHGRLRLFSIGYSSNVTEWDLVTGRPNRHSDGNHSEVWCFAAQPRSSSLIQSRAPLDDGNQQNLVAGCADGTLVLLSTAENDLRFEKFISRSSSKKARVLSVTYKDRNTVLAGFADSTIRIYDTRNGNVIRNISLGSGPIAESKDILVWKVKCLANGDFVSGDSTGGIGIFDGKNYSQLQRISGHEADVLDLAVSQDGNMIFSGGMDRRTCSYSCSKKKGNRGERWRKVSHKRYHDHDVKAMATYEGNMLSIIVSGGIDTQPVVIPLRQFGNELSRGLPALPQDPSIVSAPKARLMVSWWNCELRIWRVKSPLQAAEKPKVVARLAFQGDENIMSVSITPGGDLLVVATANEVKLFQLSETNMAGTVELRIRKLQMPTKTGGKLVRFAPDGKWLAIVTAENDVRVFRIVRSDAAADRPRVLPQTLRLRRLRRDKPQQDSLNGAWGFYSRSITHLDFSTNCAMLAVADLAGYVDTWVLEGHEDSTAPEIDVDEPSSSAATEEDSDEESDQEDESDRGRITILGQRWIHNPSAHLIPRLDSQPLLLSFQPELAATTRATPNGNPAVHPTRHNPHPHPHGLPDREQHLFAVSAAHQVYQFEVLAGRLSQWSRRNPRSSYPTQFQTLDGPAKGCTWDVNERNQRVWLYGEKWLFMFDLSQDFPLPAASGEPLLLDGGEEGGKDSKKRKRQSPRELPRKSYSGAGNTVPDAEAPVTKMRKFAGGEADESLELIWTDLKNAHHNDEAYESIEDKHHTLTSLRRSGGQPDATLGETESGMVERKRGKDSWWHTFKYRPILGIVPVGGEDQPLEVVLVERPSWDLDLPPRFVGSHE